MKSFCINQDMKIVLYGCTPQAKNLVNAFKKKCFNVVGLVDQKAEKLIEFKGIPVIKMDQICELSDDKDKVCVIIMLRGVIQHKEVVRKLHLEGYTRLIYIPFDDYLTEDGSKIMGRVYNRILHNDLDDLSDIPISEAVCSFTNYLQVQRRSNGNLVTCMVPISIIFSISREKLASEVSRGTVFFENAIMYSDKGIYGLSIYWELYNYLSGKIDECVSYLDSAVGEDVDKRSSMIEMRKELYYLYCNQLMKNGMKYFWDSAARASVSKSGKVSIEDGLHRIVFLAHKGFTLFPVTISREEYKWLLNERIARECRDLLKKYEVKEMFAPIAHISLYQYPCKYEFFDPFILKNIQLFFVSKKIPMVVLDISHTEVYFTNILMKLGVEKVLYKVNNLQERQIADVLQRLYQLSEMTIYEGESIDCSTEIELIVAINTSDNCDEVYNYIETGTKYMMISSKKDKIYDRKSGNLYEVDAIWGYIEDVPVKMFKKIERDA